MFRTRTTQGPWLYFQFAYFVLTLCTVLHKLRLPHSRKYRAAMERRLAREIIITNELGTFSVNPKNDSLTKSMPSFEHGHHDWLATPRHRQLFVDIGANIGFYSFLAVKQYGYERVLAFEPNPHTYKRLMKNIALNKRADVITALPVGVGGASDEAVLNIRPEHTGASSFIKVAGASFPTVRVPVTTLDEVLRERNINPHDIGFIKIDVEGYEHHVLSGMQDTLREVVPATCLFIEVHPRAPDASSTHELLRASDFALMRHTPQHNFLYQKTITNQRERA